MKRKILLCAAALAIFAATGGPALAETYEYTDLTVTESASYSSAEFSVTGTLTLDTADGDVTLTFSDNSVVTAGNLTSVLASSADDSVAEIRLYDSSLTVTGTTYPTEESHDGYATSIYCENSSVTLNDVTITAGNMSVNGDSNSTLEITGTLYVSNSGNDTGGIASASLLGYLGTTYIPYFFTADIGTIILADVVFDDGYILSLYADTVILTGSFTAGSQWPALDCEELIIVISENTYATSDYAVSGNIFAGGNIGQITISVSEEFLAEIVAGTATEYNLQIFDETAQAMLDQYDTPTLVFDDSWNIDGYEVSFSDGVVTVTAIPEPSGFGMLAGFAAAVLTAARRSRRSRESV